MKILVFSDTHLYLPFDQKKFDFLKKIISESDQVIINGDFFDSYMNTFDEFIKSPWKQLFPLLKKKEAVYLFGNHDLKKVSDNRVGLFSVSQKNRHQIIINNKKFLIEHGHLTRPTLDTRFHFSWEFKHYGMLAGHIIRNLFVKIFGKLAVRILFGHLNGGSKIYIEDNYHPKNNEFYVIGHNHFGEVDEKSQFAASGMILYGFAQYLTIDSITAKTTLHEEWYNR